MEHPMGTGYPYSFLDLRLPCPQCLEMEYNLFLKPFFGKTRRISFVVSKDFGGVYAVVVTNLAPFILLNSCIASEVFSLLFCI